MDALLLVLLIAGFLVTLFLLPFWIRKAHQIGLTWDDMNKLNAPRVAGSGGVIAVLGFILTVLLFIAYRVFYLKDLTHLIEILASLLVICLLTGIGFVDDLLGWRHGGLSKRSRLLLVAFSAIPLMVINAGKSSVYLPFLGISETGLLYPLIIIPLGIIGATTTFNFLAGFNGLEAGQGIIILSAVGLIGFTTGNPWISVLAFAMVLSLLAFLIFNITPAKVFPGDSLTYAIGGLVAILAILGNFERACVFFFIPYIVEVVLKSRGKLMKHSFGKPLKDGSLDLNYPKIYGTTHLMIYLLKKAKIRPTEMRVVFLIWAFQLLIILLGLFLFRNTLF